MARPCTAPDQKIGPVNLWKLVRPIAEPVVCYDARAQFSCNLQNMLIGRRPFWHNKNLRFGKAKFFGQDIIIKIPIFDLVTGICIENHTGHKPAL